MRGDRVLFVTALACVLGASGCWPEHHASMIAGATDQPVAHHRLPAQANPDLATVMERFYQQVEGAHWPFAYVMLSPRYRATLGRDAFVARYEPFTDLDVTLQQHGDRVVIAAIAAHERAARSRARKFEETTTLAWDGEDWKIDRIVRRDVSASRTR